MFNQEVEAKDGSTRMVFAASEKELKEAVKALKEQDMPTYPNINFPVEKGHDLTETTGNASTVLVDGTGEGEPVLGADEPEFKTQGDPGDVRPLVGPETTGEQGVEDPSAK